MSQISSHEQPVTPQQLALEIFHSMDVSDALITESGTDFHLRKSSLLVDVADLGLLARRVLNGLYFLAQGNPDAETHTCDLRYFKWLINFASSNNNIHLKKVIREAQKSAVQVNVVDSTNPDDDNWISVPMLGPAGIRRNEIAFKIPLELKNQLRDPDRYSLLSMRILAAFSSIYALELYERICCYKQEGATPWWRIDDFRSLIKVDSLKSANDFRYFNRDIIQPAIDQINTISDIDIASEIRRTGRSYSHLRFTINSTRQHNLLSSVSASKELYETLTKEFGLSDKELDEVAANRDKWTDDRLREMTEFVRHRCQSSVVKYPGKLLMTALREGYRFGEIEKKSAAKGAGMANTNQTKDLLELRDRSPVVEVILPSGQDLQVAWDEFSRSIHARLFKNLPRDFDSADTRMVTAFKGWLQSRA